MSQVKCQICFKIHGKDNFLSPKLDILIHKHVVGHYKKIVEPLMILLLGITIQLNP